MNLIGYLVILDLCILRDSMLCDTRLYFDMRSIKVLVAGTLFSLMRLYNMRVLSA